MSAQGHLIDAATRHQIYIQRYASGELSEVARLLEKAIREARGRLEGLTSYGTKRYQQQIRVLSRDLADIYAELKSQLSRPVRFCGL